MSKAAGLIAVSLGAVANGSFAVPLKLCRRKYPELPDSVFQAYWSLAVGIISVLTIPLQCAEFGGSCFEWKSLGLVAGLACALATLCTFVGVRHLGVGLPPSIYAFSFIIAGAIEDVNFLGKSINDVGLFVLSMLLILGSAIGVGISKFLSARAVQKLSKGLNIAAQTHANIIREHLADGSLPEPERKQSQPSGSTISADEVIQEVKALQETKFSLGLIASLAVGIFGSCVPLSGAKAGGSPFAFLPSFGIGVIVVHMVLCPVLYFGSFLRSKRKRVTQRARWSACGAAPYALLSGLLWGLGNVGLSFALTSGVDFAVAVSIYQSALLVSGVWGIFMFREIKGQTPMLVFFFCAIVILVGISLESAVVG